ncbi:glycosyl transferase [Tritrichomonas foetus]|uniref:Glycosyl transferase n=1 Tax=Tritrichomonas foetus TaxID=1144522 RepID=A0A1J4KPG1_9EUKA|nr:glycosyl transferase [Tritrichomonas foetus]|eukprot:OHT12994.1 glycosyl transferase [Tritrichomonas foetus]
MKNMLKLITIFYPSQMSSDIFASRVPLFTPADDSSAEAAMLEQIEQQAITIPVSSTLLEVLANVSIKDGSLKHISAILDEIVKSPSYFFPDVPLLFERQGIQAFVPDDNNEHNLNWRSIILQFHISILSTVGWAELSKRKSVSFRSKSDEIELANRGDFVGSRAQAGRTFNPGSISMRSQNRCIASFSDRAIGSIAKPSFESIQYEVAPPIDRQTVTAAQKDLSTLNLEINSLFDAQIQCSFENTLFRAIVLAIVSRGLYDRALGNLIVSEFHKEFEDANIQFGRTADTSAVFEGYYATLMRSLLSPEVEEQIRLDIIADNIGIVLSRLEPFTPFDAVPHARAFIESVLAPLCYHENEQYAARAEKLYTAFINGHSWELRNTEVVTADQELEFEKFQDYVVLLSAPHGNTAAFTVLSGSTYKPFFSGYYDFCYAKISSFGEFEIDQNKPCGRYIVLPAGARKEIIHELPAFDDKGVIQFDELTSKLETLANAGVTAVHVTGVIERNFLYELTSVTDHSIISEKCGGKEAFKELCERAKTFGLRVLIDFTPLVCLMNSSKKYSPFTTLTADKRGRLLTADIPDTEMLLLNYRSLKLWELLASEITSLCDQCEINGFYLGPLAHWDTVLARDLKELTRYDSDHTPHYGIQNIIDGTIVSSRSKAPRCGMSTRNFKYSPFIAKLMRTVWSKVPNAFVWMQCEVEQEPFVMNSGVIPANYAFRNAMQSTIEHSVHNDNVDTVNANEALIKFYEERNKRNPKGTLNIAPFGSLMDGPYNIPMEGLPLAIDLLFYLSDVPLISGCLDTAMFYVNAYSMFKHDPDDLIIDSDDEDDSDILTDSRSSKTQKPHHENKSKKRIVKGTKWLPPTARFTSFLKNRAGTRTKADWVLGGDIHILPVSYDSHPMRAILAVARICKKTNRCALICSSFYMYNLIYEVGVLSLPILQNVSPNAVVEIKPLIGASGQPTYYGINEVTQNSSSLFLDLGKFETALYEIEIINNVPPNIQRILNEHIYTRLERAIHYKSNTILANNKIFNEILNAVENEPDDAHLQALIESIPQGEDTMTIFREALVFATRNHKVNKLLVPYTDDDEVMKREEVALRMIHRIADSKLAHLAKFGQTILRDNDIGPILFVASELGPFSKVGGLSTMVWELAKELVQLGLDIHCVSPYYNVSPKGETGYLEKYGIEFKQIIDVYAPDQIKIGIHYGVVDGVKCWFLHHYTFFAAPYQTGSSSFRLQILVIMAKASLEMCCQFRMIPKLIVSNDWMTGLVPAIARKQFGSVFNNTQFIHIFHNLGVGYAGKIWPNNGDTGSLRYIHQLPDEMIVDNFDHSIDPSQCVLLSTDQWATVSKKYRDELLESSPYTWLLKRYPCPFAYSNGIRFQERLDALKKLNMTHDEAKRAVQKKYFGCVDDTKCLFVFVGRIVEQKGVHLIIDCFEELNRQFDDKFQFIVGGQAAPDDRSYGLPCTQKMWDLKQRFPRNFWADPSEFFSDGLLACQAADFTLVPSMFEPSGIVQQEAFASGCPVIAFRTGGLADTVFEYDREKQTGNGFTFWSYQHHDYIMAIKRAYEIYLDKSHYWKLRENAFKSVLTTETVAVQWSREFARMFLKFFEKK